MRPGRPTASPAALLSRRRGWQDAARTAYGAVNSRTALWQLLQPASGTGSIAVSPFELRTRAVATVQSSEATFAATTQKLPLVALHAVYRSDCAFTPISTDG